MSEVNFNIIENYHESEETYEKFIELYNEDVLTIPEIQKLLNISANKYRKFRKKAITENRLKIQRGTCPSKQPKYYYKHKQGFYVVKTIHGKQVNFGVYPTESIARSIVKKLIKHNWNKKMLPSIQKEVAAYG